MKVLIFPGRLGRQQLFPKVAGVAIDAITPQNEPLPDNNLILK